MAATPATTLPGNGNSNGSESDTIPPATSSAGMAAPPAETEYYISEDFFANWDNWPRFEGCDFSDYLNDFGS